MNTFEADPDTLPPLTRTIRDSFSPHAPHPVPSAEAIAAILNAFHQLELQVIATRG